MPVTPLAPPELGSLLVPYISQKSLSKRRVLGAGFFGEVCLSWWEDGRKEVAVKANGEKSLNAAAIDNERKLLELLVKYPHDNILKLYGIVTDGEDGDVRLVMEYCAGGSLEEYLRLIRDSGQVRSLSLSKIDVSVRNYL